MNWRKMVFSKQFMDCDSFIVLVSYFESLCYFLGIFINLLIINIILKIKLKLGLVLLKT